MNEKVINERFLPIGTVVLLKNNPKKLMISSYLIFSTGEDSENNKMFDYGACPFPEGIIDSKYAIGFNHDDILEIIHLGLEDDDQKKLSGILNKSSDYVRKKFNEETNK